MELKSDDSGQKAKTGDLNILLFERIKIRGFKHT